MLVESLSSGGAERQMCILAAELKRRGHDVRVVTYAAGNFYAHLLEHAGVEHTFLGGIGSLQWLQRIRRFLRTNHQDVVLAFLESCGSYAELAALPYRRWGLVVSERCAWPRLPKCINLLRKRLHLLADAVTTNSHTNRLMLEAAVPALKLRLITIYNALDLNEFKPESPIHDVHSNNKLRLIVAGRISRQKNTLRAIEAIDIVRNQCNNVDVTVDWYGNAENAWLFQQCRNAIKQRKLSDYFLFQEETPDIISKYQKADAVLLPSLYEGLPNAVWAYRPPGSPHPRP